MIGKLIWSWSSGENTIQLTLTLTLTHWHIDIDTWHWIRKSTTSTARHNTTQHNTIHTTKSRLTIVPEHFFLQHNHIILIITSVPFRSVPSGPIDPFVTHTTKSVWIESNRIKSNQIKSNQIKSNQIESNHLQYSTVSCKAIHNTVPVQKISNQSLFYFLFFSFLF
jgi:hypothetical protein